jgi:cytochrome d ubiquinol oxidase subunit I
MVALGSLASATWIIAANSWMQTPQGADLDVNGIFHAVDWWAVVFTPSFPYRLSHMVCASFVTTSFVVAGISAIHLLRQRHLKSARVAFSMAMWAAIVFVPLQIAIGDAHGRNTLVYQPTKLAAMEGLWDTGSGVPMTIFAWPDMAGQRNRWAIEVPKLASLYLTHSLDGTVQGLKAVPANERPNVPIVFFAFRIMVGIGMILLAIAICGAVLRWKRRLCDTRWFQIAAVAVSPLGFIAVLAGWVTTEAGRQPYVVYGYLRTADAVSPVAAGAIATTLVAFAVIYNLLLATFLWFLVRIILRGPDDVEVPPPLRQGLDKAAVRPSASGGRAPDGPVLVAGE